MTLPLGENVPDVVPLGLVGVSSVGTRGCSRAECLCFLLALFLNRVFFPDFLLCGSVQKLNALTSPLGHSLFLLWSLHNQNGRHEPELNLVEVERIFNLVRSMETEQKIEIFWEFLNECFRIILSRMHNKV